MAEYAQTAAEIVSDGSVPKIKKEDWEDFSVLGSLEYKTCLLLRNGERTKRNGALRKSREPTTHLHSSQLAML